MPTTDSEIIRLICSRRSIRSLISNRFMSICGDNAKNLIQIEVNP